MYHRNLNVHSISLYVSLFWCVAFTTTADQNLRLRCRLQLPVFDLIPDLHCTVPSSKIKRLQLYQFRNECNKGLIFNLCRRAKFTSDCTITNHNFRDCISIQHGFEENPNKTITTKIHTSKFLINKLIMTVSFSVFVLWHWILSVIAISYQVHFSYRSLQFPLLAINEINRQLKYF